MIDSINRIIGDLMVRKEKQFIGFVLSRQY